MAAVTVTCALDSNNITKCESADSGNWVEIGGNPASGQDVDIFIQGSAARSKKVSGTNVFKGMWYDIVGGGGSAINMTTAGNEHVWMWMQVTTVGFLRGIGVGGITIRVGSSTTDYNEWYVDGSQTYPGGWQRYVIDTSKPPSNTGGAGATLSAVTHVGGVAAINGTAKSENFMIDRIDYGDGAITVIGGDGGDADASWALVAAEDDLAANKWGICSPEGTAYRLRGPINIGDAAGTASTVWTDVLSSLATYADPIYLNASVIVASAIDPARLCKITFQGNGTGTTDITFGSVVGSGDDRQGVAGGILRSDGPKFTIDGETDIADLDTINLYGMVIIGAGVVALSGSTKTDVISTQFILCDQVEPNDSEFIDCKIILPRPDRGLELLTTHNLQKLSVVSGGDLTFFGTSLVMSVDITGPTYVEYTDEWISAAAGDVDVFDAATPATGDYFTIGVARKFTGVRIDTGTVGTGGGTVAWEYPDSASTWAALPNLTDNTNAFTTTGFQNVFWDRPIDWVPISIDGSEPLYFIRARLSTVYTVYPLVDQGNVNAIVEHGIHIPAAGTYSANGIKFFGFDPAGADVWHIENSVNATLEDSYALSNQNSQEQLGNGTITGIGQSITGAGGVLCAIHVLMAKSGTPTGDITCSVYAHTGTFGTSSVPTGAALATSKSLDVSTFTGGAVEYIFEFDDELTLVNTTKYVIAFEYSGGDASNYVFVGLDNTAPSHGGNKSENAGGWTAQSGEDVPFLAITDGLVIINASNDANPTEDESENTGTQPGAVDINNTVTVKVVCLDGDDLTTVTGARVYLTAAAGGDLAVGTVILNDISDGSGIVQDTGFNFTNTQPVVGYVRKMSASPLYKEAPLSGDILISVGFNQNAVLTPDE